MFSALRTALFTRYGEQGAAYRIENVVSSGMPDCVLCVRGETVWAELKVRGRSLRPAQEIWHKTWRAAGGKVVVVRSGWKYNLLLQDGVYERKFDTWRSLVAAIFP